MIIKRKLNWELAISKTVPLKEFELDEIKSYFMYRCFLPTEPMLDRWWFAIQALTIKLIITLSA